MNKLNTWFLRFCLWQTQFEYDIGRATGMNRRYLQALRRDIVEMSGRLNRLEIQS